MDCLKDYVGPFYGFTGKVPDSGKYLTELPGISFESFEKIANQEQIDFQGVWDDLQATTIDTFREDVIAEFQKRYKINQVMQLVDLGKMITTNQLNTVPSGTLNGLVIEMYQDGMQCTGSNLAGIYIQDLSFYWVGTDPKPVVTIKFIDAETFNTEYSITQNVVAGWNSIYVDKKFSARRMFVVAEGNFTSYVTQDISQYYTNTFWGNNWTFNQNGYLWSAGAGCGQVARIQGCSFNSNNNAYTSGTNIFGLSAKISTLCAWDNVVCKFKRQFASAWQHCLAIEFLNYRINTNRLNRYTTIDKRQAQELQALLLQKYKGSGHEGLQYPGKLSSAIESIMINERDSCITVNGYLIAREGLP